MAVRPERGVKINLKQNVKLEAQEETPEASRKFVSARKKRRQAGKVFPQSDSDSMTVSFGYLLPRRTAFSLN